MATTTNKLSKAQERALEKISQAGGHGFGEYAYLGRRTAEALEARVLVTLGWRYTGLGLKKLEWAILTGAKAPAGFISREEMRRQWAEFSRQQEASKAQRTEALYGRLRALRAAKGETGTAWETVLADRIEQHGLLAMEEAVEQAEAAK